MRLTLAGAEAVSERFTDPAEAEQTAAMCKGAAVILNMKMRIKNIKHSFLMQLKFL